MPDCCANCDATLELKNQTLFCGQFCRQVADFVRYSRGFTRDTTRANDPEVIEAIRVRMAILLSGGYPTDKRHLSPGQRATIIERDGWKCRECGAPAGEIDHIAGSSADLSNLQLLCHDCHMTKTKSSFVPASEPQKAWAKELWDTRIYPDAPLRLSDDSERWGQEWRTLKRERAERLWKQVERKTGGQRSEFKGVRWSEVVAAVRDGYCHDQ
jgi:5-methylcytosine-specific restriction endonuclease McrA